MATTVTAISIHPMATIIEASDGVTYIQDRCLFRGRVRASYSTMLTHLPVLDATISARRIPQAVRQAFNVAP